MWEFNYADKLKAGLDLTIALVRNKDGRSRTLPVGTVITTGSIFTPRVEVRRPGRLKDFQRFAILSFPPRPSGGRPGRGRPRTPRAGSDLTQHREGFAAMASIVR